MKMIQPLQVAKIQDGAQNGRHSCVCYHVETTGVLYVVLLRAYMLLIPPIPFPKIF